MPKLPTPAPTTLPVTQPDGTVENMTFRQTVAGYKKLAAELTRTRQQHRCVVCGRHLPNDKFYSRSDGRTWNDLSPVCKECALKIAERVTEDGIRHEPTRDSIVEALYYVDKPFFKNVYEDCIEKHKTQNTKSVAELYLHEISKKAYADNRFLDSDIFRGLSSKINELSDYGLNDEDKIKEQILRDRTDTIRLIGYDPFNKEDKDDQPFLYSQLLGILDASEDAAEDTIRVQSAISIVRSFLQIKKIDDALTDAMCGYKSVSDNSAAIQKLQDSKLKMQSGITKLSAESCLSLKNSKTVSKGDSTWTGKIKKLKDLNMRDAEVNSFDLKTCKAMRQVLDMSNQSIMASLKLDESDYADMVAEQRDMLTKLEQSKARYKEMARILLRENLDLKSLLKDKGIDIRENLVDLKQLIESVDETDGDDND